MIDNVSVVIPCYNEAKTISSIIDKIKEINSIWEIIVIDDGSTDDSYDIIKQYEVIIIKNPYNLGMGASVKKGIIKATREYVVLIDGDGQHDPSDIPKLLEYVDEYDMVVGSRVNNGSLSKVRCISNYFLKSFAQQITKQKISDLTSGFRAFKRDLVLPYLPLFPNRFSYSTTLTICMIKSSMNIKYVNLSTIVGRKHGKSSINLFFDGMKFINIIIKIIMLYSPQTILMPFGIAGLAIAIALTVYQLVNHSKFSPNVGIFYLAGVLTILLSLIAEQITNLRYELIELSKDSNKNRNINYGK
ncbi:MAG: Undecaprenyl-phosphate 4-deoxy-4-formamido-L-arabinose transferase [Pelotomaculum sp. PtaU1.Bin035]|nr:MAG: Undecaprenyl-phosphate 4-deoxy-4-formamido-L-arabinose transferase [Pelotomaculum sp. PtaU1.Bin035]